MKEKLQAQHVMSTNLIWLDENKSLMDAYTTMQEYSVNQVPVLNREKSFKGLVTREEVYRRMTGPGADSSLKDIPLKSVVCPNTVTCQPHSLLGDVAATMRCCRVDSLAVLNHAELIGIVSSSDILQLFVDQRFSGGQALFGTKEKYLDEDWSGKIACGQ